MKRTITVPIEVAIYEPERNEDGTIASSTMFLLIGGGTWKHPDGQDAPFGMSGTVFATYLPDSCAVSVDIREVIRVGMEAIGQKV